MSTPRIEAPPENGADRTPPERELRRHQRWSMPLHCWISSGDHTVYLRVYDLSRGGLSVRAPLPFLRARRVDVRVELTSGKVVSTRAEVVWKRRTESGPSFGVKFTTFRQGKQALFAALKR